MSKAVIVGGSKGLGLAILSKITNTNDEVHVYDIFEPLISYPNVTFSKCDLSKKYFEPVIEFDDVDTLIITAGIGFVKPFQDIPITEIEKLYSVNIVSITKIIKSFYNSLLSKKDKKCFVMSSIAGEIVSPLFSVYGASKSAITSLCESLNIELEMAGSSNRITCGSTVSFSGSSFTGGETNVVALEKYADACIEAMNAKKTKVYLDNDLCSNVVEKYQGNPHEFGISSYEYKLKNNRIDNRKSITIGYLSGTFDLFHIGHLNLLRKAKEQCDYLIVGIHKDGSWKGKETFIPFEERVEIVKSIKYVDEVHESLVEDSDAWDLYRFDKLFVGSDYKGTERFIRYEKFFKDKGVEIVYFPYTKGTSSTQLREKIKKS